MKVLHIHNLHRGRGGSDDVTRAAIDLCRGHGYEIEEMVRDSRDLPDDWRGRWSAFANGIYSRAAVRELRTRLRAFRPDIVHVHELYPMISPWVLPVAKAAGVPVVASVNDYRLTCPTAAHFAHGSICTECLGGREYRCFARNCRDDRAESLAYALRNAVARRFGLFRDNVDCYFVLSEFLGEWLVEHAGVDRSRIAIVPPVVPIPPDHGAAEEGRYVAYSGRLVPEKGVLTLIEAARLADVPLRLGTDAGMRAQVRVDEGLVVYNRDEREMGRFYQGARFLVVPSEWNEPFGRVVIEAMSHGRAVIASNVGGLGGNIVDHVTGLHFTAGDSADLARKMRLLWYDPALCNRLGAAAKAHVAAGHSSASVFNRMHARYAALLANR